MADTLRDFLISVGFAVDDASKARADAAVKKVEDGATAATRAETAKRATAVAGEMTKREQSRRASDQKQETRHRTALALAQSFAIKATGFATKAAFAVEAATLGVFAGVDRAAQGLDRLTYTARLAGSTAANVTAFGYAASQLGSSRGEADAALDSFGRKLRTNGTGYARMLEHLGVKTRDASGHMRDSADIATDLGDALRKIEGRGRFGYANAINTGASLGFSEDLVRAMMNPEFRAREGQQKADQGRIGADPNAAAGGATAFAQAMRHLESVVDAVGTKIETVLFVKLKPFIDQLAAWFAEHGDKIADIVGRIADQLIRLAIAIAQQLAGLDWKGILAKIESLAGTLSNVLGTLAGDKGLTLSIGAFAAALTAIAALALPAWLAALLGVGAIAAATIGSSSASAASSAAGGSAGSPDFRELPDAPSVDDEPSRQRRGTRLMESARRAMGGAKRIFDFGRGNKDNINNQIEPAAPGSITPENHPVRYDGNLKIDDKTFHYATGGNRGAYSSPPGDQIIESFTPPGVDNRYRFTRPGYFRIAPKYDPKLGRMRDGVMIHQGGHDDVHKIVTSGCFGIPPSEFPALEETLRNKLSSLGGRAILRVGSDGSAEVVPLGTPRNASPIMKLPPMVKAPVSHPPEASGARHPLGDTPAIHQSMLHTLDRADHIRSGGTFYFKGGDAETNARAARVLADQQHRDLVRRVEAA